MKVAIISDSVSVIERLCRALQSGNKHEFLWVALSGAEALERCATSKPDVILLDISVQQMSGVRVTEEIMQTQPCPILVVSENVLDHAGLTFEAMGAGALDAVDVPHDLREGSKNGLSEFLQKLSTIEKLARYARVGLGLTDPVNSAQSTNSNLPVVVLGASSGGPQALAEIVSRFPVTFPAAIVVVQHVDGRFARELATWLAGKTPLMVRTAAVGDIPTAGRVLIAETNDHLVIDAKGQLSYQSYPEENIYRPSVDVFFESVAEHWRGDVAGVLLTGMGDDGARGLLTLRARGHLTIAQDEATSAVYGMPKAARALRAAVKILPLWSIGAELLHWSQHRVDHAKVKSL